MKRIVLISAATLAFLACPALAGRLARAASVPPSIAYVRGTATSTPSVWVAGADGSGADRLGTGYQPQISPNGAMVAATAYGNGKNAVLLYSSTGGLLHTFRTAGGPVPLAWSPDSRYVAVQLYSTATNGVKGAGLAVIDTSTDTITTVVRGLIDGASFALDGSDRIVYGAAKSLRPSAAANLFTVNPDGTGTRQITTNGRSLNPLYEAQGIVFDRETFRAKEGFASYQLCLMHGSATTQITHMKIGVLVDGLIPLAASADGNRLLAEYVGQDTNYAWSVQLHPYAVRQVTVNGQSVQGGSISADGTTLLVDGGAFMAPPNAGAVETVPFGGGPAQVLARGSLPSWDQS